jgi:hypothetical protein
MEAGPLRKALLVLTMIAASFAGGAVVNGPGLAWLRTTVGLSALRIVQEPSEPSGAPYTEQRRSLLDAAPTAPRAEAAPNPVAPRAAMPQPISRSAETRQPRPAEPPATARPAPAPPDDATPPQLEPPRSSQAPAAGKGTGATIRKDEPNPAPTPLERPGAPAGTTLKDSALSRATDAPPEAQAAARSPATVAQTPPAQAWRDLARQFETLKVERYWIEGTAGGAARFRCTVPLEDGPGVAQQFEAEASDPLTAAEMAIRRAKLWKSTETR